ncbi:hypothetical protein ACT6QH_05950 [Xanthobacter sp. TB0139]|uniref:hypothetical protein n=1 Tax=Xanthobacter sp. TB0139 TaxID=3459178 RepID=UPI004039662C
MRALVARRPSWKRPPYASGLAGFALGRPLFLLASILGLSPILAAPHHAHAGAWTLKEGAGQAILQTSLLHSNQEYGPDSRLYSSRPFDKTEISLLFEYGARDWLTLIAAPQFIHVKLGAPDSASYTGLGYVDAGVRTRLWQDENRVVSAQGILRLSGTGNASSAAAAGYENTEIDLRLLGGLSFSLWGRPSFLDVQLAQRFRFDDPPDEVHLDITLGIRTAPRWQMLIQSFNVVSEGAGKGPWYGVSHEYYKLQFGLAWQWRPNLTLQAAMVGTAYARNAPQENGLVLSAAYQF